MIIRFGQVFYSFLIGLNNIDYYNKIKFMNKMNKD